MRKPFLRAATALAALAFAANNASSGTVNTSFGVQVTVLASCTVGAASTVQFGGLAGTTTSLIPLATTFNVTCTSSTPYSVTFAGANDLSDTAKQMVGPGGAFIKYWITSDPAGVVKLGKTPGSPAGTGGTGLNAVGTGTAAPTTVYAAIDLPSWTTFAPAPGTYSDTVTVTVTF